MFLLLYAPLLIFLPILLLAGIIFVVVPGGFIVVLAAAYYFASAGVIGLIGLATKRRPHAIHASRERSKARAALLRRTNRAGAQPSAADAPSTAA
jgi:hypothetical protein